MSEDTDLLESILRRWNFLNAIRNLELATPSVIAKHLGKHNQEISSLYEEVEKKGLVTKSKEGASDGRLRVYKLTPKAETAMVEIQALAKRIGGPPKELVEPSAEYWSDLKTKLCSRNDVVVDAAYSDLQALCRSTKIWKLEDSFWNFVGDSLDQENDPHLSDLIDCISVLQTNAVSEDSISSLMNRRFSEKLMRIVQKGVKKVGEKALSCLAKILTTEELLDFMKTTLTDAFKLESDDEYSGQYGVLSETARALYKKRSEDLRKWFYGQMEDPDKIAAKRAYNFYINIS